MAPAMGFPYTQTVSVGEFYTFSYGCMRLADKLLIALGQQLLA
jgi:hypothetical protein